MKIVIESYRQDRERRGCHPRSHKYLAWWDKAIGSMDVTEVTTATISTQLDTWRRERNWSPRTFNNALMQLSGAFTYAYRFDWIEKPYAKAPKGLVIHDYNRVRVEVTWGSGEPDSKIMKKNFGDLGDLASLEPPVKLRPMTLSAALALRKKVEPDGFILNWKT